MNLKEAGLIRIPFSRLSKLELPEFAERVIEVVEKHNPEELQIKEIFDLLVAEKDNIDKLVVRYGPHPLTEELRKLRDMRLLYVSAIKFHLKVVVKRNGSDTDMNVKVAKIEINRYLGDLKSNRNEQTVNRRITQFLAEIDCNAALQTAISSLDFTEHIDNLTVAHMSIQELIDERTSSKSKRPKVKTPALKKSVLTATRNLVKQIEIAPLKHIEVDYTALINELNEVLIEYRDMINNRMLFNERKAENAENGESTEIMTTTQSTDPEKRMQHLTEEEISKNDDKLENKPSVEEEKKAAAPSSKTMQLPSTNNNNEAKKCK